MFNQKQYLHKREGYAVTAFDIDPSAMLRTKDANDAAWQPAVSYRREGEDDVIYIRSHSDFMNKFEELEQ